MSRGTAILGRLISLSTSADANAFVLPSVETPMDSRKLRTVARCQLEVQVPVEFYPKAWDGVAHTA